MYKSSQFLLSKYHRCFGFEHLSSIASIPLFLFLIQALYLASFPIFNVYSRYQEREADRFGLEMTQNNQAAAEGFVIFQNKNLSTPYPGIFHKIFLCDHPPLGERVAFCNDYYPWQTGQSLKYGKYFKAMEKSE